VDRFTYRIERNAKLRLAGILTHRFAAKENPAPLAGAGFPGLPSSGPAGAEIKA
jgi:hypothetical protein